MYELVTLWEYVEKHYRGEANPLQKLMCVINAYPTVHTWL